MLAEPAPRSLALEGDLMVSALLDDLLAVPGIELLALRDARLARPPLQQATTPMHWVNLATSDNFNLVWQAQLAASDAAWPIAPESGGVLEHLCQDVLDAGKSLPSSPPAAVRLAASKSATAEHLARRGIAVVPTYPLAWPGAWPLPCVVKPDQGAGCGDTRILRTRVALEKARSVLRARDYVVQPLVEGEALSLSILFHAGEARLLSCNRQYVVESGGRFIFKGCLVNAFVDAHGIYQALANRIAQAVPGLWGYAGIDLMLTEQGPVVLEINPRLTTCYAGLRKALGVNPASCVLALLQGEKLGEPLDWKDSTAVEIDLEALDVHS